MQRHLWHQEGSNKKTQLQCFSQRVGKQVNCSETIVGLTDHARPTRVANKGGPCVNSQAMEVANDREEE